MSEIASNRTGRSTALILCVILLLVVLLSASMIYLWIGAATPQPLPVPTPNAFDQMAKLGTVVRVPIDVTDADEATLQEFLDANSENLSNLNKAITFDSVVPIDYDRPVNHNLDLISAIRNAHRLRYAEARLASIQDRPADAANSYVKLVVASRKSQLGGLSIHKLVGAAYERQAWTDIGELANRLSAEERTVVLKQLQSLPPKHLGDFHVREKAAGTKSIGRVRAFLMRSQAQASLEKTDAVLAEVEALERKAREELDR